MAKTTRAAQTSPKGGASLARAMLREIPLGQLEVYLQVLDSGLLRGRDTIASDAGLVCGAGCDAKGAACGAWCAFPGQIPAGCFDQWGQAGLTKEDLDAIIADPASFRAALGEELTQITRAAAGGKLHLAPKVDARAWVLRP